MQILTLKKEKVFKEVCLACRGKGYISPLFLYQNLRNCTLCDGFGWVWRKKPQTPSNGVLRRFKAFLGLRIS